MRSVWASMENTWSRALRSLIRSTDPGFSPLPEAVGRRRQRVITSYDFRWVARRLATYRRRRRDPPVEVERFRPISLGKILRHGELTVLTSVSPCWFSIQSPDPYFSLWEMAPKGAAGAGGERPLPGVGERRAG
jgi:hypothetical protein